MTDLIIPNYILLVDDEEDILGIQEITLKSFYGGDVLKAYSGNQAKEIIALRGEPEIIISDYKMPDGDGLALFQFIRERKINTPFILCSGNPKADLVELFTGAYAIVEKPAIIGPILEYVKEITKTKIMSNDFVDVALKLIYPSNSLTHDYYLKLSNLNVIRIFKQDAPLTHEDLNKLKDKGITNLHLLQSDCMVFLKNFEEALVKKYKSHSDPEKFLDFSFESIAMVEKLAKPMGWNQDFLDFAKKTITAAIDVLSRDIVVGNIIKSKLADQSSLYSKHVFLTSLVGCTFCHYLGFSTEAAQMKMAMAAILHDVCVDEKCYLDIESWNRFAISKNEADPDVVKYRNHPIDGSNLVKTMKNLPPDIDQIILQHHERPNGAGFPLALSSSRISHLSSLFIITEDLIHILLKSVHLEEGIERFLLWGDGEYSSGNFKKIFLIVKSKLQAASFSTNS